MCAGLISAMGFRQVGFEYDRQGRVAGESKFPFRAMLALGVDAVLNHSLVPLRLASLTSLFVGTVTFLLLMVYLIGWIVFGQSWPRGFATTTILLLLSMTLNAMFLGIVGEYVGRIFMQSKRRPGTIVEETLNSEPKAVHMLNRSEYEGSVGSNARITHAAGRTDRCNDHSLCHCRRDHDRRSTSFCSRHWSA